MITFDCTKNEELGLYEGTLCVRLPEISVTRYKADRNDFKYEMPPPIISLTDTSTSTLSSLLANKSFLNSFSKLEFCEFNKTGIDFPLNTNARNSDCFSFSQVSIKKIRLD